MIPIGATVDITNYGGKWRGVVTSRPGPYSIEIDGWLTAPANLAKVVGEMTDEETQQVVRLQNGLSAVVAERGALRELVDYQAASSAKLLQDLMNMERELSDMRELVVAQATTNAELVSARDRFKQRAEEYANEIEKLEEYQQIAKDAATYVEDLLLLFMGERRPVRPIEPPELRRLAEFVFEGV